MIEMLRQAEWYKYLMDDQVGINSIPQKALSSFSHMPMMTNSRFSTVTPWWLPWQQTHLPPPHSSWSTAAALEEWAQTVRPLFLFPLPTNTTTTRGQHLVNCPSLTDWCNTTGTMVSFPQHDNERSFPHDDNNEGLSPSSSVPFHTMMMRGCSPC